LSNKNYENSKKSLSLISQIKCPITQKCHCEPFAFCHSERSEESRHTAQGKLREVPIYRDRGLIYPPPYFLPLKGGGGEEGVSALAMGIILKKCCCFLENNTILDNEFYVFE